MTESARITEEELCRLFPDTFRVGTKPHVSKHCAVNFIKYVEKPAPTVRKQLSKK